MPTHITFMRYLPSITWCYHLMICLYNMHVLFTSNNIVLLPHIRYLCPECCNWLHHQNSPTVLYPGPVPHRQWISTGSSRLHLWAALERSERAFWPGTQRRWRRARLQDGVRRQRQPGHGRRQDRGSGGRRRWTGRSGVVWLQLLLREREVVGCWCFVVYVQRGVWFGTFTFVMLWLCPSKVKSLLKCQCPNILSFCSLCSQVGHAAINLHRLMLSDEKFAEPAEDWEEEGWVLST